LKKRKKEKKNRRRPPIHSKSVGQEIAERVSERSIRTSKSKQQKSEKRMEKGKGVMGGGRRWAVDFTDSSTSPSSRDIPDPPGFSRASLDQVLSSSNSDFGYYYCLFKFNCELSFLVNVFVGRFNGEPPEEGCRIELEISGICQKNPIFYCYYYYYYFNLLILITIRVLVSIRPSVGFQL
jgi:hypothetical protein